MPGSASAPTQVSLMPLLRVAAAMVALGCLGGVTGFTSSFGKLSSKPWAMETSSIQQARRSFVALCAKKHSEYLVVDEDEGEDANASESSSALVGEEGIDFISVPASSIETEMSPLETAFATEPASASAAATTIQAPLTRRHKPQYGALAAGTVLQVEVGDLSLARKAWKKRRRTGSPLLVPCSVLNVDQQSMVRWNLIFLLQKFGRARKDGVAINTKELSKFYRTYLRYPLSGQVQTLGYDSVDDMVRGLFHKTVQESYGIRMSEYDRDGESIIELKAPIARRKAQIRAAKAPLLQFRQHRSGEHGDSDTLTHTGYIRTRVEDETEEQPDEEGASPSRRWTFLPLSAALRVSQKDDVDTGRVYEGSVHAAVVFDYDVQGDGGAPLLTLSLNPGGARESLKIKPETKLVPIDDPKLMLNNLSVGDGPYKAKVVHIRRGKALVDCQVGRLVSSEGTVRVLGSLRFQDSVQVDPSAAATAAARSLGGFSEFQDDEDEMEDLIEGTLDDLAAIGGFDDEKFSEEESEDEAGDEDEDVPDSPEAEDEPADEEASDTTEAEDEADLAEQLLSLRDPGSFEEGTFEEGEQVDDITEMFTLSNDGTLTYTDSETGEKVVVEGSDGYGDEDEDEDDDDEEEDEEVEEVEEGDDGDFGLDEDPSFKTAASSKPPKRTFTQDMFRQAFSGINIAPVAGTQPLQRKMLNVGDEVDVYIRSVSQQSSQFTVTTNGDAVKGKSQKQLKKEADADKRLSKLQKKFGNLERIWALEGTTCTGTIRALSKTSDGMYVQPDLDVPTGVASLADGVTGPFAVGDKVSIQIEGIDEGRGQIALTVLDKA